MLQQARYGVTLLGSRASTLRSCTIQRTFKSSASVSQKKYPELKNVEYDAEGNPDYTKLILTSRVYDVVDKGGSPLTHAVNLSHRCNAKVYLKREDLLPVFSFKLRGAYNMIAKLHSNSNTPLNGVIACSAGNHAQGVAYSAAKLNIPSTIVMPTATPSIKYSNVSRLGSQVVLYGEDFDAAKQECARLSELDNLTNIPPFNHPYVIAGQGTVGLELTTQLILDDLDAVFVPVGGGGLIAGIAAYLKMVAPHVKVIGVETYDADALYRSLQQKDQVELDSVGVFADGTAVKILGDETWRLCEKYVDEVVRVDTDELCAAIKDVFEDTRSIVEPSGALGVAGMKKYIANTSDKIDHRKKTYVPILSGANMNFDRLRFVSERAVLGEGREVSFVVSIPDRPGEFVKLQNIIHPRSITEFSYRLVNSEHPANIFVSFNVVNKAKEVPAIMEAMDKHDFKYLDISHNELAKTHGRYLVGGKPTESTLKPGQEKLYQFEFPERPGALTKFLQAMKDNWNITLFHYRNHGNDVSKVLCGFVLPETALEEDFKSFLDQIGYKYIDETDNIIYKKFLCN
ncbi:threonine ammonia-lyase, biosynthetic [Candidozyma auris]|uniref:threonine ammonia-lyase ILV1 n=1 Tax=Candidozyma auris TaxID=498019 RepID=UPI000D2A37E7|nr:threonine_ammonia-lyase,_biosynthetic [[Candida] auris]PSK74924.1 threonine ammonia-lyase, biosynthetic [[Candida] auris]QEL58944.1 threonine ammonia-lyase, biosynthetic [[Candida] auris]QEO20817.1 threonine_ammonia-lyase,_biosynthetic [[Candida] auris]